MRGDWPKKEILYNIGARDRWHQELNKSRRGPKEEKRGGIYSKRKDPGCKLGFKIHGTIPLKEREKRNTKKGITPVPLE